MPRSAVGNTCPTKSIPAGEIEQLVVDQIRCVGRDPSLIRQTITQVNAQAQGQLADLETERQLVERDLARLNAEVRDLSLSSDNGSAATARLADLQQRLRLAEQRAAELQAESVSIDTGMLNEYSVEASLLEFDAVWATLPPREQARIVHLLVDHVDYDGSKSTLSITFHATGIQALIDQLAQAKKEKSA